MENGKIIKPMEKGLIFNTKEVLTQETWKMMSSMAMVKKNGQMDLVIKANILKAKNMEKGEYNL